MLLSVVAVSIRVGLGDFRWSDGLIVLGVLIVWPFLEWAIHVFGLHLEARQVGPFEVGPVRIPSFQLDLAVARTHRAHHLNPWQLDHVMIPLHTYFFSIPANLALWLALFEPARAMTGVSMVILLGLHYELVHLMAHCRWKPPLAYYRRLWRNHRLHHCKSEKHWLGVTMLLGDIVLGTGGHPKDVETSPTCRTLGQEDVVAADA